MAKPHFPINLTISSIGGIPVGQQPDTRAIRYVVVLSFAEGGMAELREDSIRRTDLRPDSVVPMPLQAVDADGDPAGTQVTAVFTRRSTNDLRDGQLFLVLDGTWLFGLIPSRGDGNVLHVEPLLTSPLISRDDRLLALTGSEVSLDDLILTSSH